MQDHFNAQTSSAFVTHLERLVMVLSNIFIFLHDLLKIFILQILI